MNRQASLRAAALALCATMAAMAHGADLRSPDSFRGHGRPRRALPRPVRRSRQGHPSSALPQLPPGRGAPHAGRRHASAQPPRGARRRRQGRGRDALHHLPPGRQLRALRGRPVTRSGTWHRPAWPGSSARWRRSASRSRIRQNGGKSLAQIQEHMAHDSLVGWGWRPGGHARAGAGHASPVRRADRGVDRIGRRLPALISLFRFRSSSCPFRSPSTVNGATPTSTRTRRCSGSSARTSASPAPSTAAASPSAAPAPSTSRASPCARARRRCRPSRASA
jgi:hypothetical protein